jgi:endonuclease/exonuclease/phosphatase family metal-dependent hydrolase
VRLLTWNIHKGIGGTDRCYAPGRITEVLRHYDADVVLLQEVDDSVPRSGRDRQVDLLADVLGYPHSAYAPNVRLKRGCYGNATLSRYPIARHSNINLSFPMKKRRGALLTVLDAQVDGHRYTLHVVNVHLGLSGVERRWQVRRLMRSSALTALDGSSRLVIAGDMNDWTGILAGGMLRRMGMVCVTGVGVRASRTFPAWGPLGPLDRVFLRGGLRCTHHFTARLDLAREASDHLPVIADLQLLAR